MALSLSCLAPFFSSPPFFREACQRAIVCQKKYCNGDPIDSLSLKMLSCLCVIAKDNDLSTNEAIELFKKRGVSYGYSRQFPSLLISLFHSTVSCPLSSYSSKQMEHLFFLNWLANNRPQGDLCWGENHLYDDVEILVSLQQVLAMSKEEEKWFIRLLYLANQRISPNIPPDIHSLPEDLTIKKEPWVYSALLAPILAQNPTLFSQIAKNVYLLDHRKEKEEDPLWGERHFFDDSKRLEVAKTFALLSKKEKISVIKQFATQHNIPLFSTEPPSLCPLAPSLQCHALLENFYNLCRTSSLEEKPEGHIPELKKFPPSRIEEVPTISYELSRYSDKVLSAPERKPLKREIGHHDFFRSFFQEGAPMHCDALAKAFLWIKDQMNGLAAKPFIQVILGDLVEYNTPIKPLTRERIMQLLDEVDLHETRLILMPRFVQSKKTSLERNHFSLCAIWIKPSTEGYNFSLIYYDPLGYDAQGDSDQLLDHLRWIMEYPEKYQAFCKECMHTSEFFGRLNEASLYTHRMHQVEKWTSPQITERRIQVLFPGSIEAKNISKAPPAPILSDPSSTNQCGLFVMIYALALAQETFSSSPTKMNMPQQKERYHLGQILLQEFSE